MAAAASVVDDMVAGAAQTEPMPTSCCPPSALGFLESDAVAVGEKIVLEDQDLEVPYILYTYGGTRRRGAPQHVIENLGVARGTLHVHVRGGVVD